VNPSVFEMVCPQTTNIEKYSHIQNCQLLIANVKVIYIACFIVEVVLNTNLLKCFDM